MTNQHNLPDKDDAPWLELAGLSPQDIEDLRKSKKELTQYAKQKFKELMNPEPFDADKFADEERKERKETVLLRYNKFYNDEVSGLPHGQPVSMEQLQAMALECMVDALICENMNVEYNAIAIDDIKDLIARLYQQSNEFLNQVKEQQEKTK